MGFPRMTVRKAWFECDALVISVEPRGRSRCSGCGCKRPRYDKLKARFWRHLDFGAWKVLLMSELWRVDCHRCGVVVEQVIWAERKSGFTKPFEDQVAWLVQHCDKTTVSQKMRIAWRSVGSCVERAVARYRRPFDPSKLRAISVDELSYRKGQHYVTLVVDIDSRGIIWSAVGRSSKTLKSFFEGLDAEVRAGIEHVAIDMSAAYRKAIVECLPNAQIVYDRFHVQALLSKAVDQTRRDLWRLLQGTEEGKAIKGMRWPTLKRPWNVTPKQEETLAQLPQSNSDLYRAYLLKESFAGIYDRLLQPGWARRRIKEWLSWASRSRLKHFVRVARTVRQHLDGILAFFETGFTTSTSEGLNAKARLATRQAFGFHSAEAVLAMIDLRCTGIDIPLPHASV